MALKIFGEDGPKKATRTASDIVGRFRSGYQVNDRPVALQNWRITSGDPEVADKVADLFGASQDPQSWETKGEDNLEVFTEAPSIDVLLDGPKSIRQAMVLYGRKGIIRVSDGETITYPDEDKGKPDPQAGQTIAERKDAARQGTGHEPRIEVFFRLADDPDLGVFKFQSGSWSLTSDLAYNDVEQEIEDLHADHDGAPILASLALEEVSFVAKNGPRAGQNVTYTKPVLTLKGVQGQE